MSKIIQDKVVTLDNEILLAVDKSDFEMVTQKNALKKKLISLLAIKEHAEKKHAQRILDADDLYLAAKNA